MADYFLSRLPSGHAIKDIQKPAATHTVRGEQMIIAAPETTVLFLRRQCAAVVWVRSDAYSLENLEKLPGADRAYLLKLFGLASGGSIKTKRSASTTMCSSTPSPPARTAPTSEAEQAEEEEERHPHRNHHRLAA